MLNNTGTCDIFHWIDIPHRKMPVLLKVVITENPKWYMEYPPNVFVYINFGEPIKGATRYIFVTSDAELRSIGLDEEGIIAYWRERILEANKI